MSDKTIQPRERDLYRERDELRKIEQGLNAENSRLLTSNADLRATVERLTAERDEAVAAFANSEAATLIQIQLVRAEVERLRAVVETAAAMVRKADPDLADALLRQLNQT
jgi:seryl-tRNA synthetase